MEVWVPIAGFSGYSISDLGRVRNDRRDKFLSPRFTRERTAFVGLMLDGRQANRSLAKLVCQHFLTEPRPSHFDTPIHLNGDTAVNEVYNLMWRPQWFAKKYKQQFQWEPPMHPVVRNRETGEEIVNLWSFVMTHGLLYSEVLLSAMNNTRVFPVHQSFEWVY